MKAANSAIMILAMLAAPGGATLSSTGAALPTGLDCWRATVAAATAGDGIIDGLETGDAMWFMVEQARTSPADGPISEQLKTLADRGKAMGAVAPGDAASLVAQCASRWPRSIRGGTPVRLPARRFDRTLLCGSVASFLFGAAESEEEHNGNSITIDRLRTIKRRSGEALTDRALKANGIKTIAATVAAFDKSLGRAVRLGNLNDVIAACG